MKARGVTDTHIALMSLFVCFNLQEREHTKIVICSLRSAHIYALGLR